MCVERFVLFRFALVRRRRLRRLHLHHFTIGWCFFSILTTPRSLINNVLIFVERLFFSLPLALLFLLLHRATGICVFLSAFCMPNAFDVLCARKLAITIELMKIINGLIQDTHKKTHTATATTTTTAVAY